MERLAEDTKTCAAQCVRLEEGGVRRGYVSLSRQRSRVGRIDRGQDFKQTSDVSDCAPHRSWRIALTVERSHPPAAHQADSWTDSDQIVDSCRSAHAATSVST